MRGAHVHLKIEERVRTLEQRYEQLSQDIVDCEDRLRKDAMGLEAQYEKLAQVYLPRLDDASAVFTRARFPEMYRRLAELLSDKADERAQLDDDFLGNRNRREELVKRLGRVTEKIESKVAERTMLRRAVEQELEANHKFLALKDAAGKTRVALDQGQRRSQRAEVERAAKAPAYDDNTLFGYLSRAGFGTDRYRSGIIVRWLDRWIAGKIDYAAQKDNYDYLHQVEALMSREAESARASLLAAEAPLASLVHELADRHGLSRVITDGESLYRRRVELVGDIDVLDRDEKKILERQEGLEAGRSDYYQQALDEYSDFLESQDAQRLRSLAQATRAHADDDYLMSINRLEACLRDGKRKLELVVSDHGSVGQKLHGLRQVESTFRNKDYDASNSEFRSGFDIDRLLIAFVEGSASVEHVTDQMSHFHRFKRPPRSSSSGRSGFSSGGGFSSGSSFSSGGGFSSGGFSTGGGF